MTSVTIHSLTLTVHFFGSLGCSCTWIVCVCAYVSLLLLGAAAGNFFKDKVMVILMVAV